MASPSDGDSSLSGLQRRELEGEHLRTEITVPVEQRVYSLRPRKYDAVTVQRRSRFATLREQQHQRRNKRKEAESLQRKETIELLELAKIEIQNIEDRLLKRDEDLSNRIEIINVDATAEKYQRDWHPYFELSDTDVGLFKTTLKGVSWAVEKLALQAAHSVVALQSYIGNAYLFACSGTIVQCFKGSSLIVTVANLVKCPDTDEVADSLKININMHNHNTFGHLLYHDFYHNICVIETQSPTHMPQKNFSSYSQAVNFDKSCSRDVVTLGRDRETHSLLVSTGKVVPKHSKFDCEELLVSTCRISKLEVGGPLMDFDGKFIGMNYYHAKETPFIPSFIVLKCLQQFNLFRKVVRPWHGLRVRTLYAEESIPLEKKQTNLHGTTGVIIEKVVDQYLAKASGLSEGDIINKVNGVYFSNAAELGGILLDIGTTYLMENPNLHQSDDPNKMAICLKFGVRGRKRERITVVDQFTSSGLNRWPFPKPIIVRYYQDGVLVDEEWRAWES